MASVGEREASFCDLDLNKTLARALFTQKQQSHFCDILMKVCGKEISAHSNVLAAASPYFQAFLNQDLPRQFSQRSPQVIEIQIDGNEPNAVYEEAVNLVIDCIYSGHLVVNESNVCQVSEIARIMQLDNVVTFCEDFYSKKVDSNVVIGGPASRTSSHSAFGTLAMPLYRPREKIKPGKLVSVSTQVNPVVLGLKAECVDSQTETGDELLDDLMGGLQASPHLPTHWSGKPGGRIRKRPKTALSSIIPLVDDASKNQSDEVLEVSVPASDTDAKPEDKFHLLKEKIDVSSFLEAEKSSKVAYLHCPDSSVRTISLMEGDGVADMSNECDMKENLVKDTTVVEIIPFAPSSISEEGDKPDNIECSYPVEAASLFTRHSPRKKTMPARFARQGAYKMLDSIGKQFHVGRGSGEPHIQAQGIKRTIHKIVRRDLPDCKSSKPRSASCGRGVGRYGGRLQCNMCEYKTNKVRQMASHKRLHKLEQNTCYYCDMHFDTRDDVTEHLKKHQGPLPYFCPVCDVRFKNSTQLGIHMPKHSDTKPYVCQVCSAGFKWKHALRNHMVVHSNKKDHLCDTCGYATAHKSQLKAHRLIHTGKTFRCTYPSCSFQATKKQNLKYHLLTHTREKPHQCEICGQAFSLVKNMRRHMLLHSTEKPHMCTQCSFGTTRLDKLREHQLRQHGMGTPPEKRARIADLVMQNTIITKLEPITEETHVKCERLTSDDAQQQIQIIAPTGEEFDQNTTILVTSSIPNSKSFEENDITEITKNVLQISNVPQGDDAVSMTTAEGDDIDSVHYETVMIPVANFVQHASYGSQ